MKVIILAGGNGMRLFPCSSEKKPKQFLKISSNRSLLIETMHRFCGLVSLEDIIIVTNDIYINLLRTELEQEGMEGVHIITEPVQRNTAPAIGLAVKYCTDVLKSPKNEVLFISTSDHVIRPKDLFSRAVLKAVEFAGAGFFVTFGIQPNKPETGFGYIEVSEELNGAYKTKAFKEKPDVLTAEKYLLSGRFYWNSGMFAFTCDTYLHELALYTPLISKLMQLDYEQVVKNFLNMPNISIDYAVAEKSKIGVTIPLSIYWSDVGSWDSVYDVLNKDKNGNVAVGDVITVNCKNSMFFSKDHIIAGVELDDIFIIEHENVILVVKRGESQKVKKVAEEYKRRFQGRKD